MREGRAVGEFDLDASYQLYSLLFAGLPDGLSGISRLTVIAGGATCRFAIWCPCCKAG